MISDRFLIEILYSYIAMRVYDVIKTQNQLPDTSSRHTIEISGLHAPGSAITASLLPDLNSDVEYEPMLKAKPLLSDGWLNVRMLTICSFRLDRS